MVEILWVKILVFRPIRWAAQAASMPAWPAPMTATSSLCLRTFERRRRVMVWFGINLASIDLNDNLFIQNHLS